MNQQIKSCKKPKNKLFGFAFFEITLMVIGIIAFAYLISETNIYSQNYQTDESEIITNLRKAMLGWMANGLVSAQEGLWTCPENLDGTTCQEYPANTCEENCAVDCFPGPRDDFADCRLGTCIDQTEGTCAPNTPRITCENAGGDWTDANEGVPGQCLPGCCIIGDGTQTQYVNELVCGAIAQSSGRETEWQPADNEIECLLIAEQQEEGACVLEFIEEEGKNNCEFTTQASCLSSGGEFHKDVLCSNPELNTVCEKQESVSCVEGKDEVYWFDSCGNRENIYDSNKVRSWNDGLALPKEDSCSLESGNNPLGNQRRCGNCEYILGSRCGEWVAGNEHIIDSELGDYVCRDLSCVDEWGDERKNGESWCAFDSQIGLENKNQSNIERSVDVPGSRHYRRSCLDGELRTEQCADFRNEICSEQRDEGIGFSSAACRVNQRQFCLEANTDTDKLSKCEERTDCSLRNIYFGSGKFEFDMCVPKHPGGFDLRSDRGGEVAEAVCSIASQSCTRVDVKKLTGWKCELNCDCNAPEFTEAMNNLCLSLGDCGGQANVIGEYTDDGYSIKNAPKVSVSYVNELKNLAEPKKGQKAEQLSGVELASLFGVSESAFENDDGLASFIGTLGLGATGVFLALGVLESGTGVLSSLSGILQTIETGSGTALGPLGEGFSGASAGAAVGAAIGYFLGRAFGLQGDALIVTTIAGTLTGLITAFSGGAVIGVGGILSGGSFIVGEAGAVIQVTSNLGGLTVIEAGQSIAEGISYVEGSFSAPAGAEVFCAGGGCGEVASGAVTGAGGGGASLGAVLAPIIITTLIIIGIMKLLGIGKVRLTKVEFTCQPWQPPSGGEKCDECGDSGYGCSEYKCQSLGQTCEFINEGTGGEDCVDISPNDVSPPVINPYEEIISSNLEYANVQNNGFEIESTESEDGCIKEYEPIRFGVSLNEPGQCKAEVEHTDSYEDMSNFLSGSNLYKENHIVLMAAPTLSSLGVPGVEGDPDRRGNFELFTRCKDASGNANVQEHVIEFCVSPANDLTPPTITQFIPLIGYAGLGVEEKFVQFYTNEPADCKWSLQDVSYEEMENVTLCNNEIDDITPFGWGCSVILPVTADEENTDYYFRCLDQPWLANDDDEQNDNDRNANAESSVYTITKTTEELVISSVSPDDETIFGASQPISVDLEIQTSGGLNGNALCEYSFAGELFADFFETGESIHRQTFNALLSGDYDLALRCTDIAGNVATESAQFTVELDNNGPLITNVYDLSGVLNVITNEPSECAYDFESCSFNLDSGTLMSVESSGLAHTTGFELGAVYHIKCQDELGNIGGCLTVTGGY